MHKGRGAWSASLRGNPLKILPISTLAERLSQFAQLLCRDEALFEDNLFRAADPEILALLQRANEIRGIGERFRCPGVEPGEATPHPLDIQRTTAEISIVHVGYFKFATADGFTAAAMSITSSS